MQTNLGAEALNQLECFRNFCTEEEFKTLEEAVLIFDLDLNKTGFEADQAKEKLTSIKNMDFSRFSAVMFTHFGKTPSEYLNQAI